MSKLDRSKPFGEVSGDHPARFEQDGKFFNAAEQEIEVEDVVVEDRFGRKILEHRLKRVVGGEAPAAPKRGGKKAQVAEAQAPVATGADDQLAAQLGGDAEFE